VSPSPRWADPTRSAALVLPTVPEPGGHHLIHDPAWLNSWQQADHRAVAARDAVLAIQEQLPETFVADAVLAALPPGSLLIAGSSMPIRELASARPRDEVTVIANRGAAGIDGTLSTAIGAALAWQREGGGPAAALVGDLTFLHDSTGLVLGPAEPRPDLTIVVVNNDGGAIFGLLEQGGPEFASAHERIFGTPHGVDLSALCAATGTPYALAASLDELRPDTKGISVVEIRTDRRGGRELSASIKAAVGSALARNP
jgi:2-succinyl-5-enolpyruvyl-6-hydroxy-3-cyclohexene-1-carboxylate synthase